MKTILFILSICGFSFAHPPADQMYVEQILEKLYQSTGNYNFDKPSIKLLDTETLVASYNGFENEIKLERKILKICSSFGKDSTSALAFILSHELAHCFQVTAEEKGFVSDFLAFDKHEHSNKKIERNADLYGLFNCHLSGYKTKDILEPLLDKIYEDYNLKGRTLYNYPALFERQRSNKLVERKLDTLVHLHSDAALLSTCGMYELSGINLEYILDFYQGKEIYNNTGVNFLLEALNMGDTNIDPLQYPIEIDLESRLRKPFDGRGSKGLSPYDKIRRENMVRQGLSFLLESTKLDPDYLTGHINTMIAYILLEDPQSAINYYKDEQLSMLARNQGSPLILDRVKLCLALAYFKTGDPDLKIKSERILSKLISTRSETSDMAAYNLDAMQDVLFEGSDKNCDCTNEIVGAKNVSMYLKRNKAKKTSLKTNLKYSYTDKGTQYFSEYITLDGKVSIQRLGGNENILDCSINTNNGQITFCESSKKVLIRKEGMMFLIQR